jgi:hypothetical protein
MMTNLEKVARIRLVADGLRRIQEFESARYLDEYAALVPVEQPKDGVISVMDALRAIANYGSNANLGKTAEWMKCIARTALTANLSQPQPVAQGEAVDEDIESVIACLGDDAATLRDRNPEDEMAANMDEAARLLSATPTIPTGHRVVPVEPDREVVGFTSEDVHNLHSLRRVLENLSKKRAPDPRDLDAEFFVTANINHAVKSATYWLPIVNDLYLRLYGVLADKARNAASPSSGGVCDG